MIVYQSRIYRADLRANPDVLYVFGDNAIRKGFGGQAKEMRGEPNARGVATKWYPSNHPNAFFSDRQYADAIKIIDEDTFDILLALRFHKTVVFPLDGIGTGLSELPTRAPKIYDYICKLGLGAQT
jgi:hypothetical protein